MSISSRGFSLVELMVALLLAMVLITGVGSLFLSTNKTYTLQDELSHLQGNARAATDLLIREIRMSGYTGCPSWTTLANALYSSQQDRLWMTHVDKGVLGIPSGANTEDIVDSSARSEAIIVNWVDWENRLSVSAHDTENAIVTLISNHSFNKGDLLALMAKGCKQVSMFIAGTDTGGLLVSHPFASGGSLYNCTSLLQGDFNCQEGNVDSDVFDHSQSQLAAISSTAYYIRESNGVPTLYRKRGGETIAGNKHSAEALVEGIEALRFLYGYDNDGDGVANQYRSSLDIGLFSEDWKNITSVQIEMLARSFRETAPEPQRYFFSGKEVLPDDRYIRRAFVATVSLRNGVD